MFRIHMIGSVLLSTAAFLASTQLLADEPLPVPKKQLINAVDKMVQDRFARTEGKFGLTRMGPLHLVRFAPKTEEEKKAIAMISEAEWDANLYVPSRRQLQQSPEPRGSNDINGVVGASITLTGDAKRLNRLPRNLTLLEQAKRGLDKFERGENEFAFRVSDWYVAARPIRAINQTCVNCHSKKGTESVKSNDILGIAMYAFLKTKK